MKMKRKEQKIIEDQKKTETTETTETIEKTKRTEITEIIKLYRKLNFFFLF